MKCIVIETSPERTNAHPATNEDGTPHVYATITEARAELRANGYSYNRANDRYYIKGTEYRAYIIRENSEDYAEAIAEQAATEVAAKQAEQAAQRAEAAAQAGSNYHADVLLNLAYWYAGLAGHHARQAGTERAACLADRAANQAEAAETAIL